MTFAEFEKLPDELCRNSELRHGEWVELAPPEKPHIWIQQRLMQLLDRRFLIHVSTPDGSTITYGRGQSIPPPLFGGATLDVGEIFQGLD